MEKPERMTLLCLPRRRLENNIKMEFQEVESEGMDWVYLPQDRDRWRALIKEEMKILVPKNVGISCLAEGLLAVKLDSTPYT